MIEIIANNNIYGVWGSFILRNLTDIECNISFTNKIDIDYLEGKVGGEDTYGAILLGMPVQDNQVEAIEQALRDTVVTPFTKAYHFANWGHNIRTDISIVDEEVNYVTKLVEHIESGDEFIRFKDDESKKFAKDLSEGLQSHHKYDGGMLGKNLMLLAELYGENLIDKSYTSLVDLGDTEKVVLKSLKDNMKRYVNKKIEEANLQVLDSGTVVVSLFAEKHVNELGKKFIDSLSANGREVIVLIGHQTKGDDLYRIRTSKGVSASEVAHKLNRGKGKERAATVFLPKGNTSVYNTIVRTLNSTNLNS